MSARQGLLLLVVAMLVVCVTSNTLGSEKNTNTQLVLRVKVPPKTSIQTALNDAGKLDIVVCSQIRDDVSYCDDGYYCCEDSIGGCCYSGSVTLSASVCLSLAISVWSVFIF